MCVFSYAGLIFCCCDLDLDLMILIYELYSDILKMYLHTKGEVSRSRLSKVRAQTDREIHDQTRPNVLPATFTSVKYINSNVSDEVCEWQGSVYSGTVLLHCNGVLSEWSAVRGSA